MTDQGTRFLAISAFKTQTKLKTPTLKRGKYVRVGNGEKIYQNYQNLILLSNSLLWLTHKCRVNPIISQLIRIKFCEEVK